MPSQYRGCRVILDCYPAIPWTRQEWREFVDRRGIFVFVADAVRIRPAPPCPKSNDVSGSILIDEELMRHVAVKAPHIGPNLTCQSKPFDFCAGLESGIPNYCNHLFSFPMFDSQRVSPRYFHICVRLCP